MADIVTVPPFSQTRTTYFKEMFDSRDGSARGISGVSERRVFRMILDPGAEEFTEQRYPDPRGFVAAEIPFGSPHPWNALSFASDYIVIKRETKTRWLMAVNYKTAHGASDMPFTLGRSPWRLQVRGVSFSFELRETYPAEGAPAKLIATSQFEEIKAVGGSPTGFKATVFRYNDDSPPKLVSVPIDLVKTTMRNSQPQIDESGGLSVTWTRTIPSFNFRQMFRVTEAFKSINQNVFMDAPPGHVRFDVFSLDPIDVVKVGQQTRDEGQAYRVTLGFVMSVVPFTPIRLHPTFRDKEGNETPVVFVPPTGTPTLYTESFNVKRLRAFGALFDLFGALPI